MDSIDTAAKEIRVNFPNKAPIICELTARNKDLLQGTEERPALIFTHGSGGGLGAIPMVNFVTGFTNVSPVLCFKGNMNLSSRTKMFKCICENQQFAKCLGGRSMGARVAVMAATEETTHLALVSYPLHTAKDSRDQILLNLPANVKVIFVSGDKDSMCEVGRLQEVREKMKCKTWMVVAKGADHGMNLKPKAKNGTNMMGMATGEILAKWLEGFDKGATEASLSWQEESERIRWSGWDIGIESRPNVGTGLPGFEVQIPLIASPAKVDEKTKVKPDQLQPTRLREKRALSQPPAKKVKL